MSRLSPKSHKSIERLSCHILVAISLVSLLSLQSVNGGTVLCPQVSCELAPNTSLPVSCEVSCYPDQESMPCQESQPAVQCCLVTFDVAVSKYSTSDITRVPIAPAFNFPCSDIVGLFFDYHYYQTHETPANAESLPAVVSAPRAPPRFFALNC